MTKDLQGPAGRVTKNKDSTVKYERDDIDAMKHASDHMNAALHVEKAAEDAMDIIKAMAVERNGQKQRKMP